MNHPAVSDLALLLSDLQCEDNDDNSLWFQVQRGAADVRIKFRRALWHRCQTVLGVSMQDLTAQPYRKLSASPRSRQSIHS